jgi:hypothetical protein
VKNLLEGSVTVQQLRDRSKQESADFLPISRP